VDTLTHTHGKTDVSTIALLSLQPLRLRRLDGLHCMDQLHHFDLLFCCTTNLDFYLLLLCSNCEKVLSFKIYNIMI